jgi:hypothetical protein
MNVAAFTNTNRAATNSSLIKVAPWIIAVDRNRRRVDIAQYDAILCSYKGRFRCGKTVIGDIRSIAMNSFPVSNAIYHGNEGLVFRDESIMSYSQYPGLSQ